MPAKYYVKRNLKFLNQNISILVHIDIFSRGRTFKNDFNNKMDIEMVLRWKKQLFPVTKRNKECVIGINESFPLTIGFLNQIKQN